MFQLEGRSPQGRPLRWLTPANEYSDKLAEGRRASSGSPSPLNGERAGVGGVPLQLVSFLTVAVVLAALSGSP